MKTEDLITALSADLGESPAPLARVFALSAAAGLAVSAAAFFSAMGVRPDFSAAAHTVRFLFKFVVTLSIFAPGFGLALALAHPDSEGGRWRKALWLAPALALCAVVVELFLVPSSLWGARLVGSNALHCLLAIPLMSLAPLVGLFAALRHGAPTHPRLAGAAAALASAGLAASLYASNCTDDSPLFVGFWYFLATSIVVAIGFWAGGRWLRW